MPPEMARTPFLIRLAGALLAPFAVLLLLGLALALQPNIDAVFLSKLAPAEVIGWHAAAVSTAAIVRPSPIVRRRLITFRLLVCR